MNCKIARHDNLPCRLAAGIQGLYLLHYLATLVRKFGAHGAHREPDGAGDNDRTWRKRFFVLEPGPTPVLLSYRSPGEPAANTVALQGGHVAVSNPPAHSPLYCPCPGRAHLPHDVNLSACASFCCACPVS